MSDFTVGTTLLEETSWPGHQTFVTAWHFWSDEYVVSSEKEGSHKENLLGDNQKSITTSESDTKEKSSPIPFKITMRYSIASNAYVLIVNGEIIKRGSENLYVRTFNIPFTITSDNKEQTCLIHVNVRGPPTLIINGSLIPDVKAKMSIKEKSHESGGIRNGDLKLGVNSVIPISIGITDYRQFLSTMDETTITVYQIYVELPLLTGQLTANQSLSIMRAMRRGSLLIVERRYSEFERLDKVLKCLAMDSLPSLPGKALMKSNSPEFLLSRQTALNEWLKTVLEMIAKFGYPTEFFTFCGLDPITGARNAKFHGSITTSRTDSGESAASSYGSSYHSFTEDCGGVWRTTSKE